jgi:hypothetical protein
MADWVRVYLRRSEKARIVGESERGWQALEETKAGMEKAAGFLGASVRINSNTRTVHLCFDATEVLVPVEWPVFLPPLAAPLMPMEFYRPSAAVSA